MRSRKLRLTSRATARLRATALPGEYPVVSQVAAETRTIYGRLFKSFGSEILRDLVSYGLPRSYGLAQEILLWLNAILKL
jgi:hypothetical protein